MSLGIIKTTAGLAQGVELDGKYKGTTIFKGIPYAAPPVGRLRWAPPEDPVPWQGVRRFDDYAPDAVQFYSDAYNPQTYASMSEDCLYLNITTTATSSKDRLPVLLWLHGGGLTNGSSHNEMMLTLAQKGIVVVSISHRINMFGYIALPQLSAEQGKSGNYGLMDQIKALDWITDNIKFFGGDPDNITSAGVSGGCQKACILAAIPAAKSRIKKIFNASGLKWMQTPFPTVKEAEKNGQAYLKYIGIDPDTSLEKLRSMDVDTIHKPVPRHIYPGDMVYDGQLIPAPSFREVFDLHLPSGVSFINGTALGEANIFATPETSGVYSAYLETRTIKNKKEFFLHFKKLLGPLYNRYDFPSLVSVTDENAYTTARYLGSLGLARQGGNNHSRNVMLNRLFGDYLSHRSQNNKAFTYLWGLLLPCPDEDIGTDRDPQKLLAQHGTDMWFFSGSLIDGLHEEKPWRGSDYKLSLITLEYFSNFIKYGDPNGECLPPWPASSSNYGYLHFTADQISENKGLCSPLDHLIRDFVIQEYQLNSGKNTGCFE
ncbi:MAG: carboxylesterase/lipase family protein [Clostridiaceae bacterium]|nr:carboxylesterase/lipase family protein [Clostridiaceae bacterium]